MIAEEKAVTEINTVEEYSLYSLDRSLEGLDYLEEDAIACCRGIEEGRMESAFRQLANLTSQLHSFDVFENEMISLFLIDTSIISDSQGNLKQAEVSFRQSLVTLGSLIETNRLNAVPTLLRDSLVPALSRFRNLLPLLKDYISTEYAHA